MSVWEPHLIDSQRWIWTQLEWYVAEQLEDFSLTP